MWICPLCVPLGFGRVRRENRPRLPVSSSLMSLKGVTDFNAPFLKKNFLFGFYQVWIYIYLYTLPLLPLSLLCVFLQLWSDQNRGIVHWQRKGKARTVHTDCRWLWLVWSSTLILPILAAALLGAVLWHHVSGLWWEHLGCMYHRPVGCSEE